MLSYETNCLLYSAITKHGTMQDIELLKNLRSITDHNKLLEYYTRSSKLLPAIKNNPTYNSQSYWDNHYAEYVVDILNSLKAGNNDEAINKILAMLDSIESNLGE